MDGPEVGGGVIRNALEVAVHGVESMRSEWGGDHPAVVRLVQLLVKEGKVNGAMNVVDCDVREPEEEGDGERHVRPAFPPSLSAEGSLSHGVVHLAVASHVGEKPWNRHEGERTDGIERVLNFPPNLVLLEPRVEFHCKPGERR
jgi:hypothetical protein